MFNNDEWLALVREDPIDPERDIVDPHHHLWPQPEMHYNLDQLWRDTSDGHAVSQTVFVECGAAYRKDGAEHLRPVGESEFVAAAARTTASTPGKATLAGIVAHADLTHPNLDEIIDAHAEAAGGLLCGIRHSGACDEDPGALTIPGRAQKDLYANEDFRQGLADLGARGLPYDTWHYHHQNLAFRDLADAVPQTTMILNHFGTPLGVGRFAGKHDDIFPKWKDDIAAIAECPNVYAKLGGLAMPDNGFGWMGRDMPPSSDEFVAEQSRYYDHAIDCFGAERCMFESNFPVDRLSISYGVLWNGLKKIAAKYSEAEQSAMFSGTARRIYKLNPPA